MRTASCSRARTGLRQLIGLAGLMLLLPGITVGGNALSAQCAAKTAIPEPREKVTDLAQLFSGEVVTRLSDEMARWEAASGQLQFQIVTMPTIGIENVSVMASRIRSQHGPGPLMFTEGPMDAGILILLIPPDSRCQRPARLAVAASPDVPSGLPAFIKALIAYQEEPLRRGEFERVLRSVIAGIGTQLW